MSVSDCRSWRSGMLTLLLKGAFEPSAVLAMSVDESSEVVAEVFKRPMPEAMRLPSPFELDAELDCPDTGDAEVTVDVFCRLTACTALRRHPPTTHKVRRIDIVTSCRANERKQARSSKVWDWHKMDRDQEPYLEAASSSRLSSSPFEGFDRCCTRQVTLLLFSQ